MVKFGSSYYHIHANCNTVVTGLLIGFGMCTDLAMSCVTDYH